MKFLSTFIIFNILIFHIVTSRTINIGGIFNSNSQLQQIFTNTINDYNNRNIKQFIIKGYTEYVESNSSYTRTLCSIVNNNVMAVFSEKLDYYQDEVIDLLNVLKIPLFLIDKIDYTTQISKSNLQSIFYLDSSKISSLHDLIIKRYNNIIALVNHEQGLNQIENLMSMFAKITIDKPCIKLKFVTNENFQLNVKNDTTILLDIDNIKLTNKVIDKLTKNTQNLNIIALHFGLSDLDKTNIKSRLFQLIGWGYFELNNQLSFELKNQDNKRFMRDGIDYFINSINNVIKNNSMKYMIENFQFKKCEKNNIFKKYNTDNEQFLKFLKSNKMKDISFKSNGEREVNQTMIWFYNNIKNTIEFKYWSLNNKFDYGIISNLKKIKVVTIISEPFVNSLQSGYLLDLLNILKTRLGLDVTLHEVNDRKYGSFSNNKWTGMIGELLEGKADLILAPLTETRKRAQSIQFTKSFMSPKIMLVYAKVNIPNKWSGWIFLAPLNNGIFWFYLFMSLLIGGLCGFGLWLSIDDWKCSSKFHCGADNRKQWIWLRGLQLSFDAVVRHPARWIPASYGVRCLLVIWWIFTLFLTLIYISNFINIKSTINVQRSISISSIDQLINSPIIPLTIPYGSTHSWIKDNYVQLSTKIDNYNGYVSTITEGMEKVLKSNNEKQYGFILESSFAERYVSENCNLKSFIISDYKSYAFATRFGSPLNDKISQVLLDLQETQVLTELYKKWFKFKRNDCLDSPKPQSNTIIKKSQYLSDLKGIFYLLLILVCLSIPIWFLEHIYYGRQEIVIVSHLEKKENEENNKELKQDNDLNRQSLEEEPIEEITNDEK